MRTRGNILHDEESMKSEFRQLLEICIDGVRRFDQERNITPGTVVYRSTIEDYFEKNNILQFVNTRKMTAEQYRLRGLKRRCIALAMRENNYTHRSMRHHIRHWEKAEPDPLIRQGKFDEY